MLYEDEDTTSNTLRPQPPGQQESQPSSFKLDASCRAGRRGMDNKNFPNSSNTCPGDVDELQMWPRTTAPKADDPRPRQDQVDTQESTSYRGTVPRSVLVPSVCIAGKV